MGGMIAQPAFVQTKAGPERAPLAFHAAGKQKDQKVTFAVAEKRASHPFSEGLQKLSDMLVSQ